MIPVLAGLLAFAGVGLLPQPAAAQTPFVPYYGKNRVKYDTFKWSIYTTEHFEIYYYPELEQHLQRVAGYAESAYQHVSSELKHDLPGRVPLVLFKTQAEFQQQNISGDELPEGVLAFAEPSRDRMVLPIDEPPDQLYHTIVHELTHVFEFDIIPRGLVSSGLPLWVDEGLADFMAGGWNPLDLMQVRDAAISDNVPAMSDLEVEPMSGRLAYSMGHATFEFIQGRWGMEGLRQFLFSLRKSVIGGGESAYEEALKLKPEDFDEAFERYLKDRFKPFRDKELPSDYGKNLSPSRTKHEFVSVVSLAPSPSGDMLAAVTGNRKDMELDIILVSTKDGQFVKNLTKGFDQRRGFEYIATAGGLRGNLVPWIAWAPVGDHIAYFARTEKQKSLIVQNVVTGRIVQRVEMKTVDMPESPVFSPDGKRVAFSALERAVGDIYVVDLATGALTNVTKDAFADYAPAFSPDGRTIVYTARISGNDKLFSLDLASGTKKQLTFGTHDDTGARFMDPNTLLFVSTATDPNKAITPDIAKNGMIPNVWTLDLRSGALAQWTDSATGVVSPVPITVNNQPKIALISYDKGENGIHLIETGKAVATANTSDFGAPGPVIDFQAPLSHALVRKNIRPKGLFEKFSLDSRPGVSLGVTSNGNFYGGTNLTFTDVLGDKQMNFTAESVSTYRTFAFSFANIEHRLQYGVQAFLQDEFFYSQNTNAALYYDPSLAPYVDRDTAISVSSVKGASVMGIYPLNRYVRAEFTGGFYRVSQKYDDPSLDALAAEFQQQQYGTTLFNSGNILPLGLALTRETTVFREFGPVSGATERLEYQMAPKFGSFLSRQSVDVEARRYYRIATTGVLALRFKGFKSWGDTPAISYFGGNGDLHGTDYLSLVGHKTFYANAQLRFPIIEAALTPFGVMGGVRGMLFFDIGGAGVNGTPFTAYTTSAETVTPIIGYTYDRFLNAMPVYGAPVTVSGFRLADARAAYGFGLETFVLGFPMHFDWSWRTTFNATWEDVVFFLDGGSTAFRKPKFSFWIGYDW